MSATPPEPSRRDLLRTAAIGSVTLGCAAHFAAWGGSLAPVVRYEPGTERRLGSPARFPEGSTFLREERLFVLREEDRLRVISAVCTHLGCTVNREEEGEEGDPPPGYRCPCHGSAFAADGKNESGPAPRPLPWHPLRLGGDGVLIVDLSTQVGPDVVLVVAPGAGAEK